MGDVWQKGLTGTGESLRLPCMSTKPIVADQREPPGDAIDRLAREQGRTKWWVARELGTHPSHLSKLISGERRITPRLAKRLAELFGVPVTTFLQEEEE